MSTLPVESILPEIRQRLGDHNRLILEAPPGAGKTTAVPLALLAEPWLRERRIVMLEPRRLAARNAALRMAGMLGETPGETVGFQIRQERCVSRRTRILVVTEGILTRMLQGDPALEDTALVIFDEFHERSLHADLALALALQSQQLLRDDLKILLMSATLDSRLLSQRLDDTPVLKSEGRQYPVELHYAAPTGRLPEHPAHHREARGALQKKLLATIQHALQAHRGSILVFLPGAAEIRRLQAELEAMLHDAADTPIAPLYGELEKGRQQMAIAPAPAGQRKIVLATNIAETSLTIEGIECVIDSGLERYLHYDPARGMNSLRTRRCAADSATQRSGRAGRLGPGHAYRLWSEAEQRRLPAHHGAEILHSDLAPLCLELAAWGVQQTDELFWLDPPPEAAVAEARTLLRKLGAIDDKLALTAHGQALLQLGAHPRLGHMMLHARRLGQPFTACLLAALLTERDISRQRLVDIQPRLAHLWRLHQQAARQPGQHADDAFDNAASRYVLQCARDYFRRLQTLDDNTLSIETKYKAELTGVLIALAYPERLAAQRANDMRQYQLANGKGAFLPDEIMAAQHRLLAVAHIDLRMQTGSNAQTHQAQIRLATPVTQDAIEAHLPGLIETLEVMHWDTAEQRVVCEQQQRLGKIRLRQKAVAISDYDEAHRLLLEALKAMPLKSVFNDENAERLRQRVRFLRHQREAADNLPDADLLARLPDWSDEGLKQTMETWLLPHLQKATRLEAVKKLDFHALLRAGLDWPLQQALDTHAPETLTVPSGSRIRIDYSDPQQAVLAVRLQEVFGWRQGPAIMQGRHPLLLRLLSPGYKPVQQTRDLASFWQNAYHEVRKELRGRYKKHYWPEDPLNESSQ